MHGVIHVLDANWQVCAFLAMFALERGLRLEEISSIGIASRIVDTLVTLIMTYAAKVWGCFNDHVHADKLH